MNTDTQGRFAFSDLRAAAYTVSASRFGYAALDYGQERAGQQGKLVQIADGSAVTDINIALPRGSAITGTITDEAGDPIEDAVVRVLKISTIDGRQAALAPQGTTSQKSDDRGRYRLYGLLPGRYLVSATTENALRLGVRPNGVVTVDTTLATGPTYAPMLYPGTPDASLATPLTVDLSRDLDGIDVSLRPAATATVTGKALDSGGRPIPGGVILSVSQRSGGVMVEPRQSRVDADGSFAIRNVPPGEYVLQAMSPRPGAAPDFATEFVRVADVDPPPTILRTSPGPIIEGRLVREGPDGPGNQFMVMPFPTDFDRSPLIGMGATVRGM